MNIPSNFSLEEIIKYCSLPEEAKNLIEQMYDKIVNVDKENDALTKRNELLEEQIYFRDEFIRSTKERCESVTKCKELVKDILTELDDSYIEL
jgi:hypothetical protein